LAVTSHKRRHNLFALTKAQNSSLDSDSEQHFISRIQCLHLSYFVEIVVLFWCKGLKGL